MVVCIAASSLLAAPPETPASRAKESCPQGAVAYRLESAGPVGLLAPTHGVVDVGELLGEARVQGFGVTRLPRRLTPVVTAVAVTGHVPLVQGVLDPRGLQGVVLVELVAVVLRAVLTRYGVRLVVPVL